MEEVTKNVRHNDWDVKWYLSNVKREWYLLLLYINLPSENHELQKEEDARKMKQKDMEEKMASMDKSKIRKINLPSIIWRYSLWGPHSGDYEDYCLLGCDTA
jgi:hypothetical protein